MSNHQSDSLSNHLDHFTKTVRADLARKKILDTITGGWIEVLAGPSAVQALRAVQFEEAIQDVVGFETSFFGRV